MKKILLILLCLCAILFTACTKENSENNGSDSTSQPDNTTEAPVEEKFVDIIKDSASDYTIIYPFDSDENVYAAASKLKEAIKEKYGVALQIKSDMSVAATDREILIGLTDREASKNVISDIGYLDYVFAMEGSSLVIFSNSSEQLLSAVDAFAEKYFTQDSLTLSDALFDVIKYDYPKPSVSINGSDISEFNLIYGTGYLNTAKQLSERIGELCGFKSEVSATTDDKLQGKYILVGEKDSSLGAYDFKITARDNGYVISGGSKTAVSIACNRFLLALESEKADLASSDIELNYTLPDRQVYINDISKLALNWEFEFRTPEWMLDFDEKYAATLDPSGRLMSCLHRGDMVYYPENSIEGLISAIMMGGDMVEIDPRRTKDGVLVLLHDETLTRTTNVDALRGKNGLPDSVRLVDWTYEQLQQLSLKSGTGGNSASLTPFKIPTLEEAIKVCAGRIFIRLDVKTDSSGKIFWEYENDIMPLMRKYNSYDNVIFTWHYFVYSNSYALPKKLRPLQISACGRPSPVFARETSSVKSLATFFASNGFEPCMRLGTSFGEESYKTYLEENKAWLNALKGVTRTYADVHGTNSAYPENKESPEFYAELYEGGINYLLVNKGLMLCQYIAENFEPTAYSN